MLAHDPFAYSNIGSFSRCCNQRAVLEQSVHVYHLLHDKYEKFICMILRFIRFVKRPPYYHVVALIGNDRITHELPSFLWASILVQLHPVLRYLRVSAHQMPLTRIMK